MLRSLGAEPGILVSPSHDLNGINCRFRNVLSWRIWGFPVLHFAQASWYKILATKCCRFVTCGIFCCCLPSPIFSTEVRSLSISGEAKFGWYNTLLFIVWQRHRGEILWTLQYGAFRAECPVIKWIQCLPTNGSERLQLEWSWWPAIKWSRFASTSLCYSAGVCSLPTFLETYTSATIPKSCWIGMHY